MNYKVQRFFFESGERCALLINSETSIPLMYENLYVTTHIRNAGEYQKEGFTYSTLLELNSFELIKTNRLPIKSP